MKRILFALLVLIILGTVAFILRAYLAPKTPGPEMQTQEVLISPTPSPTVQATFLPTQTDEELIKIALVQKHGWDPEEILVTVSKNDGQYAQGSVREKSSEVGGGYFFAAKVSGQWQIVADGQGTIACEDLEEYPNFPASMIPECFDETTGKSVKR